MKTVYHPSNSRGLTAAGWLNSRHSFSFADWIQIDRMGFGALRVLNDDLIMPESGFGPHSHANMEIVTVVLQGEVSHEDSMGNSGLVRANEVQTMSAGKRVTHAEMNNHKQTAIKLLQLWIETAEIDMDPAYDQKSFADMLPNAWTVVAGPAGEGVSHAKIHQQAWVNRGDFEAGKKIEYAMKAKGNGAYLFVIDGEVQVGEQRLVKGDGFGVWETDAFTVDILAPSKLLLVDVPMKR